MLYPDEMGQDFYFNARLFGNSPDTGRWRIFVGLYVTARELPQSPQQSLRFSLGDQQLAPFVYHAYGNVVGGDGFCLVSLGIGGDGAALNCQALFP